MDLDDIPIGKVLTRREALAFLGASGAYLFFGCSSTASTDPTGGSASCVARPALTEGPYYVDEELNRSDIRTDPSDGTVKPGALLALTFNVSTAASSTCAPLAGAVVDVWHCDALGAYSDVSDPRFNTVGRKFLRGYQVTGADGVARFTTIYPGWYQGRAVHLHFKVRSPAGASPAYEFTSQLFFDDALTDQVHAQQPYAAKGQRTLRNSGDGIYNQGGSQLVLSLAQASDGYEGSFDVAVSNG
ncbi:MAG TPA: intradiol ring-cleavage dioxygenase [Gemmatimonadales bacterium]|nr:intradiol ring-cleavage dioxygenase [Gemmatimonadales bacterium]